MHSAKVSMGLVVVGISLLFFRCWAGMTPEDAKKIEATFGHFSARVVTYEGSPTLILNRKLSDDELPDKIKTSASSPVFFVDTDELRDLASDRAIDTFCAVFRMAFVTKAINLSGFEKVKVNIYGAEFHIFCVSVFVKDAKKFDWSKSWSSNSRYKYPKWWLRTHWVIEKDVPSLRYERRR